MKFNRIARCKDGWFISFVTKRGFLLLMLRPGLWRWATIRPQNKPGVTRRYIGPIEIEVSNYVRRSA